MKKKDKKRPSLDSPKTGIYSHVVRPASASGSEGEPLPAEGSGEANMSAGCRCGANFRITKNGVCLDCLKKVNCA